jgi:hypothetical protein
VRSETLLEYVEGSASAAGGDAGVGPAARGRRPSLAGAHSARNPSTAGPPTVVIIADIASEHFDQLASTLRRRGVGVIRVFGAGVGGPASGQARTRWLRDRLLYDASIPLPECASTTVLDRRLGHASIVDVLVSDSTVADGRFRSPAVADLAASALAYAGQPAELVLDKFKVNELLARAGLRVPAQFRVADLSPKQAATKLGLPLIVKKISGSGGAGVRLASTIEQVEQAVAELAGADPSCAFYQQHIDGEMVMYGCVRGPAGPLLEQGLEVIAAQWPLGPSLSVRLLDDPALLSAGRSVAEALGCRGFADIGFLRDANGDFWHVDANCRSWGNMISLLATDVDFAEAYVALLNHAPYARRSPPPAPAAVAYALPFALYEALSHGSGQEIWSRWTEFARMCRRGPGLAYASVISIKAAAMLLNRVTRAAHNPRPGLRPTTNLRV